MDKEFDAVKEDVSFLQINTTTAREHVGEIERKIRTVKEQIRCTTGEFPFQYIPTRFLFTYCTVQYVFVAERSSY